MTPAPDLIDRLEKAREGSRELDVEICKLLEGGEEIWLQTRYTGESYPALRRASPMHIGGFANEHVPFVTTSVDAALALVSRCLPDSCVLMEITPSKTLVNLHTQTLGQFGEWHPLAEAPTAPLAILTALLHALRALEPQHEE